MMRNTLYRSDTGGHTVDVELTDGQRMLLRAVHHHIGPCLADPAARIESSTPGTRSDRCSVAEPVSRAGRAPGP